MTINLSETAGSNNQGIRRGHLFFYLVTSMALFGSLALIMVLVIVNWTVDLKVNWLGLGMIIAIACLSVTLVAFQFRKGHLDYFSPLVFGTLIYICPNVFIKGTLLVLGEHSQVLSMTGDTNHYLVLALSFVLVGWFSLGVGYILPFGQRLGKLVRLPGIFVMPTRIGILQSLITLGLGVFFVYVLSREGAYGSSLGIFKGDYLIVSLARPLSVWVQMTFFLIVWMFFKESANPLRGGMLIISALITSFLAVIAGSRAQLFYIVLLGMTAYYYSRHARVKFKNLLPWISVAAIAGFVGIILISQYREIRVSDYGSDTLTFSETTDLIQVAAVQASNNTMIDQVNYFSERLLERVNSLELLAITLARSETLQSSERFLGIDNNIIKDVLYALIPRPLWPEKPIVGEFGLLFTRIYLNSDSRSWSGPSVIGDLYRNFGLVGVIVGMLILGIYLRFIYERFVVASPDNPLAILIYYFLLSQVNWEGAYSSYLVGGSRIIFSYLVLVIILAFLGGASILPTLNKHTPLEKAFHK